jgi:hypothetical protein
MTSELNILNKHFKKMFPFVIEVRGFNFDYNNQLNIGIYVSHTHYAELSCEEVSRPISNYMLKKSTNLIKSVLPDWDSGIVKFRFFPEVPELTVFNGLDYEGM